LNLFVSNNTNKKGTSIGKSYVGYGIAFGG